MSIKNVTVLGSGLMGNGLALVFAKDPETHVILRSRSMKSEPLAGIRSNLDMLIEKGAMTEEEAGGNRTAVQRKLYPCYQYLCYEHH